MYSTCIFCHGELGANESIEHFPVGQKLAFDAEKGRRWAVCPTCVRWNLSPLEERWEAVEECERRFRATTLRTSTENIGLARLRDGTELVRIGRPLRPEFAAWRYGREFAGRQTRAVITGVFMAGVAAGMLAFGPASLLVGLPALGLAELWKMRLPLGAGLFETLQAQRQLRDDAGQVMITGTRVFDRVRMRPEHEREKGAPWELLARTARVVESETGHYVRVDPVTHVLTGAAGLRALGVMLAHANGGGAGRYHVGLAVTRIERARSAEGFLAGVEDHARKLGAGYRDVWDMPVELRLAMEMAAHEDAERRAMQGELAELERHWREAEELAAIADALPLAPTVEEKMDALRAAREQGRPK